MDEKLKSNYKQAIVDKYYNPDPSLIGVENRNLSQ